MEDTWGCKTPNNLLRTVFAFRLRSCAAFSDDAYVLLIVSETVRAVLRRGLGLAEGFRHIRKLPVKRPAGNL